MILGHLYNKKYYQVGLNFAPCKVSNKSTQNIRDVAQSGSAHAWGAWGRRFKSCHPDLI